MQGEVWRNDDASVASTNGETTSGAPTARGMFGAGAVCTETLCDSINISQWWVCLSWINRCNVSKQMLPDEITWKLFFPVEQSRSRDGRKHQHGVRCAHTTGKDNTAPLVPWWTFCPQTYFWNTEFRHGFKVVVTWKHILVLQKLQILVSLFR